MERLFTTGEAGAMLGIPLSKIDYACAKGKAGPLSFCGGRRALTAANVRNLARYFGKPVPPCCRDGGDGECRLAKALDVRQGGR